MQESTNNPSRERRQEHRDSVRQPAILQSPEHGEINFLIRNFSPTSMYLGTFDGRALSDDQNANKIRQGDEIFVRVEMEGKPVANIAASVDRVGELGLGINFFKLQEQLNKDLKELANQQGFVTGDASPLKSATRTGLLKEFRKASLEFVKRYSKQLIKVSNEALFDMAGKVGTDASQSPFFDAMGILRKHGEDIRKQYVAGFERHQVEFKQVDLFAGLDAEKSVGSELSLVDEREFEDWLAISEIMNTAESHNHRELHMLEARMAVVLDARVDSRNNPVSPAALCHHLYEAINAREFERGPLQVIWRSFNETSLASLTTLYQQLNQLLIEAGILPKLSFRFGPGGKPPAARGNQPAASQAQADEEITPDQHPQEQVASAPAGTATPPSTTGASGATIIDLAQILRARQPAAATGEMATGRPAKPFGMDELNEALLNLQAAGQSDQQPLGTRINDALKNQQRGGNRRELDIDHAQSVFLAQELLTAIQNDDVLEPQAKQWVQKLEVPLLRLLLNDDAILREPQHPARQLINQLGHAQAGLSDPKTDRDREVVDKIETIVDGLSHTDSPNTDSFADATAQIKTLLKRQQRLRSIQVKRVLEACDGQQKLDSAKTLVQDQLDRRFAGEQVPRVIVDLLEIGLRKLLDLAAVRSGMEGDDYIESIGLVDDLRSSLSPHRTPAASDQQDSELLLERIDEKLLQVSADAAKCKSLKQRLNTILPGLGGNTKPQSAELIEFPRSKKATPSPEQDGDWEEGFDQDHALWLGRAKLMQVGSWMLYPSADGKTKPLKLAWVSEEHDRYVFVNRQGHKALEITPTELADQLKGEQANIIEQPAEKLMDRSWQGMMQHMHEQIAHQATHDQLTDVLNRKEFERQLRLKLGESKLMQSSHVALQLDIDQFRVINSTAGHDAGDQLLRDIAKLARENLPPEGMVARLGGDEFAILLPRTELAPGHEFAETFRQAIGKHRTSWKRHKLKSTASIGLVAVDRDCESVSQTLNQLESACAAANDAGGNRVKSYQVDDEEMTRRDRSINWVKALETGLDAGRVELYGQRIISLDENNRKEHYEVLARLRDENGEFISPEDFVPAAEAYGRIHLLDEWVFKSAFEALANSPRSEEIERLSLNVSGKTFSQPRFVRYIKGLLKETGIHASKICFEITETAAISNLSRCTDCLRELRMIGCRFSLDDFGTGLSSFSYLKNLPVDYLKIDGSFVKEIVTSTADYGLVKTINEIGHFLGKKTVAEYVENEAILKRIKEIGLDYAQGFGIAKPKPLSEILNMPDN